MSMFMQLLIFISSVIFIIETLETFQNDDMKETLETMHVLEWICVIAFTIEYVIRMFVCEFTSNLPLLVVFGHFMPLLLINGLILTEIACGCRHAPAGNGQRLLLVRH